MKNLFLFLFVFLSFINNMASRTLTSADLNRIKKGWNFGFLPVVSYNTDLGLQYGLLTNFYNYGDGKVYPEYYHSIYLEASYYTKGSGIFRLFYDSKYLIKGIRTTFDLSYLPDQALDFYGFNGYNAVYHSDWTELNSTSYKTRVFYKHKRNMLRAKIDLQKHTNIAHLNWSVGLVVNKIDIATPDIARLNKGKKSKLLPDTATLYEHYVDWGIIKREEAKGGFLTSLKAGLVYDTRDNEPNPVRGIWTEMVLIQNISRHFHYTKLAFTHRQYFTWIKNRLSFVYRLGYQGIMFGKSPFYALPFLDFSYYPSANNDGLGGSRTLRGIVRNRVVGKGLAFANVELRWRVVDFRLFKQNFYCTLSPFLDAGQVVNPYEIDTSGIPAHINQADYFNKNKEKLHVSYGLGLHIVMNENFVISADFGLPISKQDGQKGFYISMNFLF